MRNKDKLYFINQIVKEKQCNIHVMSTFFCEDEDLGYQTEKCTKQCDGCSFIEKRVVK